MHSQIIIPNVKVLWIFLFGCLILSCKLENEERVPKSPKSSSSKVHTGYLVSDVLIEVTGKWIVPEHFKNIIKSKSGMPFSEDILREDVERIYASGYAEMVIVKVEYIGKKVKIRLKITAAEPA